MTAGMVIDRVASLVLLSDRAAMLTRGTQRCLVGALALLLCGLEGLDQQLPHERVAAWENRHVQFNLGRLVILGAATGSRPVRPEGRA
jgi:hypothetical protein